MGYNSLHDCIIDLEKNGHLIRIKEEVDPHLEMASVHLRVYEQKGPAIYFEKVKGSPFGAVSNLFGTIERSKFIFRDTLSDIQKLVDLKFDPLKAIKKPLTYLPVSLTALSALPLKVNTNHFLKTSIDKLPLIQNWVNDGGPFITLPQVYTEDIDNPGVMKSNVGMYRIQLAGNDYKLNEEIGLHYQLHRGIGVHQTKSNAKNKPLKVSIFVGGPPAHTLAAVMPLPESLSELMFAGALNNRRFRYHYDEEDFCISNDADFVITGEVHVNENKPEGPFGDHLGYYSLKHDFPLMKVKNVYHKKNAIWPFTVVGRPPQEDTSFGALIHEITGAAIPKEISGLHAIHAVDLAGVHPLLFAIGSERYTPYLKQNKPQELLTIANQILGKNQLSLAKYLWIANKTDNEQLDIHDEEKFIQHILERINLTRDLHFYTQFTMDTLDYSGHELNGGSKVVLAACGKPIRTLGVNLPDFVNNEIIKNVKLVMPGVLAISTDAFNNYELAKMQFKELEKQLLTNDLKQFPLIVWCDDADFIANSIANFVWTTFTRSNPSHDIYGVNSFTENKHWGCMDSLVIDARSKAHHAPVLELIPFVELKTTSLLANYSY